MRYRLKLSALQLALLALFASAALQFTWFALSPRDPMNDVDYSIFAAQNLLARGELKSVNILADYKDDLAQFARLRWMVHFPPGHSLLYAAAMSLGLDPSNATNALALVGILVGGIGWIFLARFLKASRNCIVVLAALYPWLPWAGRAYQLYETEHVALAVMPWFCLTLLSIAPVGRPADAPSQPPVRGQGHQLLIVILLALVLVTLKYSMSPVFLAAALYLVLQDGLRVRERSIGWKAALLGLILAPLLLVQLVNTAYGPRVLQDGPQSQFFGLPFFARNLLDNSVAATLGWNRLVQLLFGAAGLHPFASLITILSLASLGIWIAHFRRHPPQGRVRSFVALLLLLTIALWLSLAASTYLAKGQWNFSAEARFYMPITLMWLLCGAVSLDAMRPRAMFRSPAFYVLAVPILLTAAIDMRVASRAPAGPAMPESGIGWNASHDAKHALFLSGFAKAYGHKPDLLIAMPSIMNELAVPSFATGYLVPTGHHYWSSKPLELWALVRPSQEQALLDNCAGAQVERVGTPAAYPFSFYIIKFEAKPNARQ